MSISKIDSAELGNVAGALSADVRGGEVERLRAVSEFASVLARLSAANAAAVLASYGAGCIDDEGEPVSAVAIASETPSPISADKRAAARTLALLGSNVTDRRGVCHLDGDGWRDLASLQASILWALV